MSKKFDAKSIRMNLKRHATTADLMAKFDFTSPEEMYESLHRAFPQWAQEVISELRQNDKAYAKRGSKRSQNSAINEEEAMSEEITTGVDFAATPAEQEDMHYTGEDSSLADAGDVHATDVVSGTETLNLESLLEEEKRLSDLRIGLEVKHKELVTSRADCVRELQKCRDTIVELQRLISENRKRVASIASRYDNLAVEMSIVSEDISATRTALEDVRAKILIAKRAAIYVFSDGSIEVENANIPSNLEMADLSSLVQRPEAEELTIREIKAVAKLIRIIEWLKSQEISFELSFDSEEVRSLYEAVMV